MPMVRSPSATSTTPDRTSMVDLEDFKKSELGRSLSYQRLPPDPAARAPRREVYLAILGTAMLCGLAVLASNPAPASRAMKSVMASSSIAADHDALTGTWEATQTGVDRNGKFLATTQLSFLAEADGALRGIAGSKGDEHVDLVIGAFDFGSKEGVIVDLENNGRGSLRAEGDVLVLVFSRTDPHQTAEVIRLSKIADSLAASVPSWTFISKTYGDGTGTGVRRLP